MFTQKSTITVKKFTYLEMTPYKMMLVNIILKITRCRISIQVNNNVTKQQAQQ